LVSWNVLHYEGDRARIVEALKEYRRVLKPGGRLILSTVASHNEALKAAEFLGGGRYRLGRGFRKGEIFFCCGTEVELRRLLNDRFEQVLSGRVTEHLFTATNDALIATGTKGQSAS